MNGRTIKKVARKHQFNRVGRAIVTVRLPQSVFPYPYPGPLYASDWGEPGFSGYWSRKFDGGSVCHSIATVYSKWHPYCQKKGSARISHIEGSRGDGYNYLESCILVETPKLKALGYNSLSWGLNDSAAIEAHWRYRNWIDTATGYKTPPDPTLQVFTSINYAKSMWVRVGGDYAYLSYSVKIPYVKYFARELHGAFRIAKQNGVNAKLMRRIT